VTLREQITRPPLAAKRTTMKAIVQDRYGSADVLEFRDIEEPAVGDDDVLVRVHAAGCGPDVWHLMTGMPYMARLAIGLRKPKLPVLGWDVAGTVGLAPEIGRWLPSGAAGALTASPTAEGGLLPMWGGALFSRAMDSSSPLPVPASPYDGTSVDCSSSQPARRRLLVHATLAQSGSKGFSARGRQRGRALIHVLSRLRLTARSCRQSASVLSSGRTSPSGTTRTARRCIAECQAKSSVTR
jgi:hypothetical protein